MIKHKTRKGFFNFKGDVVSILLVVVALLAPVAIYAMVTTSAKAASYPSAPEIRQTPLSGANLIDGRLLRFYVFVEKGSAAIGKFTFKIDANDVKISGAQLSVYADGRYIKPLEGYNSTGIVGKATLDGDILTVTTNRAPFEMQAQTPYFFELRGSLKNMQSDSSVTTTLLGDNNNQKLTTFNRAASTSNFVWTPNTNGQTVSSDPDWTNSRGLSGLPATGITQTRTK